MYAPRRSAGAKRATTDWDVGTQSISPITKIVTRAATTTTLSASERTRKGKPISGIATASLTDGETCATARVSRSWPRVTNPALMMIRKPQIAGAIPCDVASEIGSKASIETYVIEASTEETTKSRKGWSRRTTAKELRSGADSGA